MSLPAKTKDRRFNLQRSLKLQQLSCLLMINFVKKCLNVLYSCLYLKWGGGGHAGPTQLYY